MTMLKYGGKFDKQAYKTSGGLHGIGVKAVNFLSQWCEVEVRRDGHVYQQEYERGKPLGEVSRIGTADTTGTRTTFKPDPEVFLLAAARANRPAHRCVVFEDAPVGIEAAAAAGMKSVGVASTRPAESLAAADRVIDRLDELPIDELASWF